MKHIKVKTTVLGAAMTVAVLLAAGQSPIAAQEFPVCFLCANSPWIGCPDPGNHTDETSNEGLFQGQMHECMPGDCDDWIGEWGHEIYAEPSEEEQAARDAVAEEDDDLMLKVLFEHQAIRLNVERSALQVVTDIGTVTYHVPLEWGTTERLAMALDASQWPESEGRLP